MKRILLVLPSSTYRTTAFMAAAARLEVDIVVASDHRQAMAGLVPDTTVALNFRKPGQIAETVRDLHSRKPLNAVVGVDDLSAYVAAIAARALNLPYNPPEGVAAARNKLKMRQMLSASGLQSPKWRKIYLSENIKKIAGTIDYPAVIKPVFLSASRGVTRVDTPDEFISGITKIRELLQESDTRQRAFADEADYILAEDYIPGVEVALEGIMQEGNLKTLAIFDKPDPLEGPYFVETIYVTPSRLPAYVLPEISRAAQQAALALGLRNGPIHAEIRVNEKGAWVVEIAARSIGGLCSKVLQFDKALTLEDLILRQAIGLPIAGIQRNKPASAVMMIPIPRQGILERVDHIDRARQLGGISDIIITIANGQQVLPMPWGGRYLGFIFAVADLSEEAEQAVREAHRTLDIRIMPSA